MDEDRQLVTLEEQDRSLWDRFEILEAAELLARSWRGGEAGPYGLQAAIAACQAALGLAPSDVERRFLHRRLADLT